jgi:hypothetical protein
MGGAEAIPIMNKGDGFREGLNPSYDRDLPDEAGQEWRTFSGVDVRFGL